MPITITTKMVKDLVKSKDGRLPKSFKYESAIKKFLILDCGKGHSFKTNWDIVSHNHWCPKCKNIKIGNISRKNIDDIKDIINHHNGIIVGKFQYINEKSKIKIKCENGHIFTTNWHNLHKNHWCVFCANQIINPRRVKNFIIQKGGILKKDWRYINSKTKFSVRCKNGHNFVSDWSHIKQNKWCPYCSPFKTEQEFRKIIGQYFNVNFIKSRYKWLTFQNSKPLELDGYNDKIKVAFEYQGFQHYTLCYINHNNQNDLQKIIDKDCYKVQKCNELGICLIVIPYWVPQAQWRNEIYHQHQNYLSTH